MNAWKAITLTSAGLILVAPALPAAADDMGVGRGNGGPDSQPAEPAQTESATESYLQSLEELFDLDVLTEQ